MLVGFFLVQAVVSLLVSLDLTIGIYNGVFWTIIAIMLLGIYRSFQSRKSKLIRIFYILATLTLVSALAYSFEGLELPSLPIMDWLQIGFTILAGMFAVAGIYRIRKNRLKSL